MHLDKQHPTPMYLQLKEMLQSQIEQGKYQCNQKLPSERDLCQSYSLSRMTARRALQALIESGLAYTQAGKGTFVKYNPEVPPVPDDLTKPIMVQENVRQDLIKQLLAFDNAGVAQVVNTATRHCSLEIVATRLFPSVIAELEQRWLAGKISLLAQNYAITTLHAHLVAMINAASCSGIGPKIVLACAPGDQHEIGLLLLALTLKRRGYVVIYLGVTTPTEEFHHVVHTIHPHLVCLSAATTTAAHKLIAMGHQCKNAFADHKFIQIAFGGIAFQQHPALIKQMPGLYLGDSLDAALTHIQALLADKPMGYPWLEAKGVSRC